MKIRMKVWLVALVIGFSITTLSAQSQGLRMGYYGESISHYGFKVGYEQSFLTKTHDNRKGTKISDQLLLSANVSGYRHPHHHIGVILSPELTARRTGKKGRFKEVSISPALFRYFYEGTTYEYVSDHFEKVPLAGRTAFLPTIGIGGGRDLSVTKDIPMAWYWRANIMKQYPYNTSSLLRISAEVGVIKKINTKTN